MVWIRKKGKISSTDITVDGPSHFWLIRCWYPMTNANAGHLDSSTKLHTRAVLFRRSLP